MLCSHVLRAVSLLLLLSLGLTANANQNLTGLSVYEDVTGQKTIQEIASLPDDAFVPVPNGLSAGYTRSVHWLRFSAQAPSRQKGQWLLEVTPPYLDDLRLFSVDPYQRGAYIERRMGDMLPFSQREHPYRGFIFRVDLEEEVPRVFHLRLQTTSTSLATLNLMQLERFSTKVQSEYALLGVMFGMILIILVINLIHWLSERERIVLQYLRYITMAFLNSLFVHGFAAQYLFQDQPVLANHLQNLTALLVVASAATLYPTILKIERRDWLLWWSYRALFILPLVSLPALFLGYSTEALRVVIGWSVIVTLFAVVRSFHLMRQNFSGSSLLFTAILFSLLGVLGSLLQVLGVLPSNFFMLHALLVGLTGNIIALHLGIAIRMRAERQAQQAAVRQAKITEARAEQERIAREEQAHFISMLAHELRTPIAGIAAAVDAIEIISAGKEIDVHTRVERIRRGVRRITGVADRYLHMDRADNARLQPRFSPHTLKEVVQLAVELLNDSGQRLKVGHVCDAHLLCDSDLVATAILNLIDNAIKYSPEGSPVDLSADLRGNTIEIKVEDRGLGVPESMRSVIFDRYVRAAEHANVPGIGVGLALVRKIAEVHNGRVDVEDRAGGGASFRLQLPLDLAHEMSGFDS